jgi:hypothetical protein
VPGGRDGPEPRTRRVVRIMLPRLGGLGSFWALTEVAAAVAAAGSGTLLTAGGWVVAVTASRVLAGRHMLGEVLGTGGMATVWRA